MSRATNYLGPQVRQVFLPFLSPMDFFHIDHESGPEQHGPPDSTRLPSRPLHYFLLPIYTSGMARRVVIDGFISASLRHANKINRTFLVVYNVYSPHGAAGSANAPGVIRLGLTGAHVVRMAKHTRGK